MSRRARRRSPLRRTRVNSIVRCAPAELICAQNLARIQNPFWIESFFQRVHDGKLNRIRATRELPGFEPSNAVFGADAAAQALDQIEHRQFECVSSADELRHVRSGLLTQIEVQIAVACMTV